jgi:LCP family protein required for cell wall assembly
MPDDEGGSDPHSARPRPGRGQGRSTAGRGNRRRAGAAGGSTAGRGHSGRRRLLWRITGWLSVVVVVALTTGALVGYGTYRTVWDSIGRFTIAGLGKRPPAYNDALNILVFGTDSRAGLDRHQQIELHVGPSQGEQDTDTVMIVHILPGRKGAIVVSIPRDTQVPYYGCPAGPGVHGQQQNLSATEQINAVFAAGGPSCLWKTVEQQTGIRIDHAIELDFTGFVKIINDIGGVNVCVSQPVSDSVSGLRLKRGVNHIGGVEALKYWRTREGIGMGDDPERIERDQFLMASVLQGVTHDGLLGDPAKLVSVLHDAAGAMTMDEGMTPADLLQIGESMRGLSTGAVQFITSPWIPDPGNANWVDFEQPQASQLFSAIAQDKQLPKPVPARKAGGNPGTTLVKTAQPSTVRVEVLNGNGIGGEASTVAASLTGRGFKVVGTTDAPSFSYAGSVIEYASAADLPAADTLKAQLTSVTLRRDASLAPGAVDLIVGSSYTGLKPPAVAAAASQQSVSHLSKKYSGITGSTPVCRDQAAFAGPLGY